MRFKTEREILAHGRDIAKRIDPELPTSFQACSRACPTGSEPIPPDRARTAAPYMRPPAMDGSRAGNFYLRTADPETQSKCCMEALILHEAVLAITCKSRWPERSRHARISSRIHSHSLHRGLGIVRRIARHGSENVRDPYESYGQLKSEIMRALRLVTDTGIHNIGWTREQAIATMYRSKGGWITDAVVAGEVDRYIAIPAQALAYKVGELKIKDFGLGPKPSWAPGSTSATSMTSSSVMARCR